MKVFVAHVYHPDDPREVGHVLVRQTTPGGDWEVWMPGHPDPETRADYKPLHHWSAYVEDQIRQQLPVEPFYGG